MKVQIGKGPLSKDKKTPFVPNNMYADTIEGWRVSIGDSTRWDKFATAINDEHVKSIIVIDQNNTMYTFEK